MGAAAVPLAAAGIGAAGNIMGANASADASRASAEMQRKMAEDQLKEQQRQFNERKGVMTDVMGKGKDVMQEGETGFMNFANTANPELDTMKKDILGGENEALGQAGSQMAAQLALQGVRGGQANTLMKRNLGSMGTTAARDVNAMIGNESMQRAAEKRAFLAAKAAKGASAYLPGTGVGI